jgi:adenine-specific DNA-methyltransferase
MTDLSSSDRLSASRRKDLGAFYTPRELSDFAVAWAIDDARATALDPGCGDAAFLLSAARRLRSLGASSAAASAQLSGVDLNADAIETAATELGRSGVPRPTLIHSDFFQVASPPAPASSSPPRARSPLKLVDAVVGNPPYVRYQLFRAESRKAALRAALRAGVLLPELASSWAPYVIHASSFLRPGGRLALVLPGELLHVGYAAAVREFMLRELSDLTIVTFEEKVFPGALEEVIVVLGVKAPGDGKLRVCRVTSLRDLEEGHEAVLARARVCSPARGERWLTALLEQTAASGVKKAIDRARFRTLGDLGRADIGVVTGANDFFVLGESDVAEHKIPASALMPVVSKAAHVPGARFTAEEWRAQLRAGSPAYLLVVDEARATGRVARYLEIGERLGLPARYKCRTRSPWYRVPYVRKPDLFLTYMAHVAPRLVVNEAGATSTNTVHGIYLADPSLAAPLAAAFLCSATLLSAEMEGRSYGGGVLKLEPREALRVRVPELGPRVVDHLRAALPSVDALVRSQRVAEASALVDRIVMGSETRASELDEIREALVSLRARRLSRARSAPASCGARPLASTRPLARPLARAL